MELLISLISGTLTAGIAGGVAKRLNMGALVNSAAGICGGGLGAYLVSRLGNEGPAWIAGFSDSGVILVCVILGGTGGLAVLAAAGLVRNVLTR